MSPPYYYLVIHAKNYVLSCFLINTKPIFTILEILEIVLKKTDDICIGSEGFGSTDFLGYFSESTGIR